jgi:hypothetical protein
VVTAASETLRFSGIDEDIPLPEAITRESASVGPAT